MSLKDNIWDYIALVAESAMPEITNAPGIPTQVIDAKVIWGKQNTFPAEFAPWIAIEMISMTQTGHEVRQKSLVEGVDIDESVIIHGQAEISVDVYGKGAVEAAHAMKHAMFESAAIDLLHTNKLSIVSHGVVNDLSAVVDTIWENRANFTIKFGYASVKQNTVRSIHHVPLKGDVPVGDAVEIDVVVDKPV